MNTHNYNQQIKHHFEQSIHTYLKSKDILINPITKAAEMMIHCFEQKKKILSCGNGGSVGDALHFSSEMLNRYQVNRIGLPAIALTADTFTLTSIANDDTYDHIFSKQVTALGQPNDILLAISTSGGSKNILAAIEAAHEKNISVVALTGRDGGQLASQLKSNDVEIRVPSQITAHIQEVHLAVIHTLCHIVEQHFFAGDHPSDETIDRHNYSSHQLIDHSL